MRLLNWILGPSITFELCCEDSRLPTHGSEQAVGFDLYAVQDQLLEAGCAHMVNLRIKSKFRPDWVAHIWDRSGMGKKGITRLAGVVDPDYRGEWKVILLNSTNEDYTIRKGDRIAQAVFSPVFAGPCSVGTVVSDTARGDGAYGSTGN